MNSAAHKSSEHQCGGSGMFIPDPGSDFFPSRIPVPNCLHPGSSSKNLSILTSKKAKKWFLSTKKYDPGCSSRIPDSNADFLPSRIPVKKAPNPGSRIRIRNTGEHAGFYQRDYSFLISYFTTEFFLSASLFYFPRSFNSVVEP
jgi:hypothetical protein